METGIDAVAPVHVRKSRRNYDASRFKGLAWTGPRQNGFNAKLPGAFHGATDPATGIQREAPYHRLIISLAKQGLNYQEIAETTGYNRSTVSNTLQQPWAQAQLIEGIESSVQDQLKNMLEKAAPGCVARIVTLAEEARSETVKLAANNAILDRFLGKPTQPISTEGPSDPNQLPTQELERKVSELIASVSEPA